MTRPKGFSIFAVLFAAATLAGVANLWALLTYPSQYSRIGLNAPLLATLAALYSVTATLVALGFWRAATWLPRAIVAWGVCLIALLGSFQVMIGMAGEPAWLVVLPYVIFALIISGIFRFAVHRVSIAAPAI